MCVSVNEFTSTTTASTHVTVSSVHLTSCVQTNEDMMEWFSASGRTILLVSEEVKFTKVEEMSAVSKTIHLLGFTESVCKLNKT